MTNDTNPDDNEIRIWLFVAKKTGAMCDGVSTDSLANVLERYGSYIPRAFIDTVREGRHASIEIAITPYEHDGDEELYIYAYC